MLPVCAKWRLQSKCLLPGTTSILHDSEEYVEVDNCFDSGCYTREIHYKATDRQITKLIELSNECHQYFKVCKFSLSFSNNLSSIFLITAQINYWNDCLKYAVWLYRGTVRVWRPTSFVVGRSIWKLPILLVWKTHQRSHLRLRHSWYLYWWYNQKM